MNIKVSSVYGPRSIHSGVGSAVPVPAAVYLFGSGLGFPGQIAIFEVTPIPLPSAAWLFGAALAWMNRILVFDRGPGTLARGHISSRRGSFYQSETKEC
jgi:hypothetical protein